MTNELKEMTKPSIINLYVWGGQFDYVSKPLKCLSFNLAITHIGILPKEITGQVHKMSVWISTTAFL